MFDDLLGPKPEKELQTETDCDKKCEADCDEYCDKKCEADCDECDGESKWTITIPISKPRRIYKNRGDENMKDRAKALKRLMIREETISVQLTSLTARRSACRLYMNEYDQEQKNFWVNCLTIEDFLLGKQIQALEKEYEILKTEKKELTKPKQSVIGSLTDD